MRTLCVLVLFLYVGLSLQISTPEDDHYIAAVVEYSMNSNVTENQINYENLIEEAAEKGADILVFPELTLTNSSTSFAVPIYGLLKEYPIPALYPDLYDNLLVSMSAAARDNQIYVVINTRERLNCTQPQEGEECPESKVYVFNTNVVFDRTGAVIDRYRKITLFDEPSRTPALKPDLGLFTTDFGVIFSHFICFDLMFQVPAVQVVQKNNIKDIIFTTMWFSEMPYLTAVQFQEAYAYTLDVNFLAAGANRAAVGTAGSGIFSGKAGALVSIMPAAPTTRLLVAQVPKIPGLVTEAYPGPIYDNPSDQDALKTCQDSSITAHITRPLVQGYQEFTIIDKDVSCTFRVRLSHRSNTKYQYRAGAFSGVRNVKGFATGGTRICGVFACTGDSKDTCGLRFETYEDDTTAIFEELTIIGTVPTPVVDSGLDANDSMIFPVSLQVSIMPLEAKEYTYEKVPNGDVTVHTLTLNNVAAELYTFALWGRVYGADGEEVHPPVEDSASVFTDLNNPSLIFISSGFNSLSFLIVFIVYYFSFWRGELVR